MKAIKSSGQGGAVSATILLLLLFVVALSSILVVADPTGSTVTSASTDLGPNSTPASRSDARGTITTLVLDAVQQDQRWKAYVGNVTGTLTLDNSLNYTIYDWDTGTVNGNVLASRNGSLDWTSVACANQALVQTESTFFSMTDANSDDINSTFNYTVHKQFQVGATTLNQNTCNSTTTYVNDSRAYNPVLTTSPYQELLITDAGAGSMIFLTSIDNDDTGYDLNTYDFQMIVPEATSGAATAYYFYVELQ
ncbi:hypothetical protein GOV11_03090 [Candidatus Woesearchaeota archaeon]|nr:hypothetical protein [Candidatus Woesearchaeota archaeon]